MKDTEHETPLIAAGLRVWTMKRYGHEPPLIDLDLRA